MTIGPEPRIRMRWMSVRLGIPGTNLGPLGRGNVSRRRHGSAEDTGGGSRTRRRFDESSARRVDGRYRNRTRGAAGAPVEPGDDIPALAGLAVHAYTDGASLGNPGPAGAGVVLLFREHRKEASIYLGVTTNNVAELTAVLEALKLVKRRDLPVRV